MTDDLRDMLLSGQDQRLAQNQGAINILDHAQEQGWSRVRVEFHESGTLKSVDACGGVSIADLLRGV